jgi:hypothetical protein
MGGGLNMSKRMANSIKINQQCIYCKKDKSTEEFDKDHVMPRAFGKFHNNLTLINAVCRECNHYFSKELELFLARDSQWGLMRYRYNLSAFVKAKWNSISHARIRLRIDDPNLGEWNGAFVDLIPPAHQQENNPDIFIVPQVAFYTKEKKEKIFMPIDEINRANSADLNLDLSSCFLYGNSDSDIQKVKSLVAELGINADHIIEISEMSPKPGLGQRIRIAVQTKIDSVILRAIAKIGFNYFAYLQGNQLALSDSFDEIREFIRYGSHQDSGLTSVKEGAILAKKGRNSRRIEGHIILVEWPNNARTGVYCRVSLFNCLTFIVTLCRSFKLLVQPRLCGHLYNIRTKRIIKLSQSILRPYQ